MLRISWSMVGVPIGMLRILWGMFTVPRGKLKLSWGMVGVSTSQGYVKNIIVYVHRSVFPGVC